jgi:hypothetical protein
LWLGTAIRIEGSGFQCQDTKHDTIDGKRNFECVLGVHFDKLDKNFHNQAHSNAQCEHVFSNGSDIQAKPPIFDSNKDDKFRQMFLRADRFNADHGVADLDRKLELFGPSKLCQDIKLADLSPSDRDRLDHLHGQYMPVPDVGSRPIIFVFRSAFANYKGNHDGEVNWKLNQSSKVVS